MFDPFFASGPFSEIVVFPPIRATFRFVRSSESSYSSLQSGFDRQIEPKTLAKSCFRRFSKSIDFETRADDFLDDRVASSRLPRHPSTFNCRSRPPFVKSSFFFEVALLRESLPLLKAIFRCSDAPFLFAKYRNRFPTPFSSMTSS